jgi:lysozyme family protein
MADLIALKAANERRWANVSATRDVTAIAKRLMASKARYQAVSAQTSVPWPVIAVIHQRESSQDWSRSLAQGDPWNRVSVRVPAGRGPFRSWEEAAIDALANCHPFLARKRDWSIGGTLTNLEAYNGIGYAAKGVPSPYIWAGTNHYRAGKYVRDGVYDPSHVDTQPGCAGLLLAMMALDPTITLTGAKIALAPSPAPAAPAQSGWGSFLSTIFSPFKGK